MLNSSNLRALQTMELLQKDISESYDSIVDFTSELRVDGCEGDEILDMQNDFWGCSTSTELPIAHFPV